MHLLLRKGITSAGFAMCLLVASFSSTARAQGSPTQITSMTYSGYAGGPGSFSCPPPSSASYQPQPMNIYVPAIPASTAPLLIFFPGTANDLFLGQLTTAHTDALVKRAAELGFVAAAISYRSFDFAFPYPDRIDAKEQCVWASTVDSAVGQLCGNQGPLATASTRVDCGKGIVVAGHSQGGAMALLSKNYDSRVMAAYIIGAGAGYDNSVDCTSNPLCDFATKLFPHTADPGVVQAQSGPLDPMVMGSSNRRVLPSGAIRATVGDVDAFFHPPYLPGSTTVEEVATRLNNVVGLSCGAFSPSSCAGVEGSGWSLVGSSQLTPCAPNTACTAVPPESHAGHCFFSYGNSVGCVNDLGLTEAYLPDPNYFDPAATEDWTLEANLGWLMERVSNAPQSQGCGCASGGTNANGFTLALAAILLLALRLRSARPEREPGI